MKAILAGTAGFVAARLAVILEENRWELGRQDAGSADCVVHFAELRSGARADSLLENLHSLERALESATRMRARFVLVTSEVVSGKPRPAPLDEESPSILTAGSDELDGAAAGLLAEHLCLAHRAAAGLHATVLRLYGAYGPEQPVTEGSGGIGDWIAAALRRQPLTAPEDGSAPCCLSHADDLARGIMAALASDGADGEIVYLGDPRPLQAGVLARWIWRLAGNAGEPVFAHNASAPRKSFRAPVDTTKARQLFGFTAVMDHEQGLTETIRWHARSLARL